MGVDQGGQTDLPKRIHPAFREHLLAKMKEEKRLIAEEEKLRVKHAKLIDAK